MKLGVNVGLFSAAISTLILSSSVNAAIISTDWQSAGDNLVTQDTVTGLEWLDLTATAPWNYDYVSSQLGAGQTFAGWRFATNTEIAGFFDAFGGDSNYYNGVSTQNQGLFHTVGPIWGDLLCATTSCASGEGESNFYTAEPAVLSGYVSYGNISDRSSWSYFQYTDVDDNVRLDQGISLPYQGSERVGSALVRNQSVVPVPAAIWLFGFGVVGLIGVARRKTKT